MGGIRKEDVMVLEFYNKDSLSTRIFVDYPNNSVKIENFTDDIIDRAFGVNEHPTIQDFEDFLEDRCFPRTRDGLKLELQRLGLQCYDPYQICKATDGRMAEDQMWIKFVEE